MLWELAWVWIAGGVVLALLEMLLPGFILLGFAIGAVCVGVLIWIGLLVTLPPMLLVMAVIAAIAWGLLRRVMGVRRGQVRIWHHDINEK